MVLTIYNLFVQILPFQRIDTRETDIEAVKEKQKNGDREIQREKGRGRREERETDTER